MEVLVVILGLGCLIYLIYDAVKANKNDKGE